MIIILIVACLTLALSGLYRNIYDKSDAMLWIDPNSRFEFSKNYKVEQDFNNRIISVSNSMTNTTSNMIVNGKKVISDFNHTKTIAGTYQLFNRRGGQTYKGEVYSVRIYNKSLTDAEVLQNYKMDKERFGITE